MLVPLHGFLKGDSLGLVVLVHDHDTMRRVVSSLQQAATCRVAPVPPDGLRVWVKGAALDPDLTVAQAGLEPLDRIDVAPNEVTR